VPGEVIHRVGNAERKHKRRLIFRYALNVLLKDQTMHQERIAVGQLLAGMNRAMQSKRFVTELYAWGFT
jgi:hypothetical protein